MGVPHLELALVEMQPASGEYILPRLEVFNCHCGRTGQDGVVGICGDVAVGQALHML